MKKNSILLALSALMSLSAVAENKPFLTKVYDFLPAPGQFVNSIPEANAGDTKEAVLKRAEEMICGYYDVEDGDSAMVYKPSMISLGSYGGYVVVGFDHPVVNVKGDYDFQIFGNAFLSDQYS